MGRLTRVPVVAWIVLGGALGTTARAALETWFPARAGSWPWTTFVINLVGSFVLGLLLQSLAVRGPDEGVRRTVRLGVGTGIVGGFTTYSTFVLETDRLVRGGHAAVGFSYALVSVVVGIAAAGAGMALAQRRAAA
ncbi:CrcB family protein [Cellulomonas sp. HZM]|uniref:fluoride efflux transporter FluC n=1 Tax=Cellulomonas sp. HZM TaxID=1454010 RepID=UPI001E45ABFF|nr:CrcB family protein [Cellulomonas sp. HZM]